MKYRILESKNNYNGKITWRVQWKFLCWWIYENNYSSPHEWDTYEKAKSFVECELNRYSSHTDNVKEVI